MAFVINKQKIEEANNDFVLPPGGYEVEVERAEEKLNKKDQEMMSLMTRIKGPKFENGIIWVNVVYDWAWAHQMFARMFKEVPNEITTENIIGQRFWVKKKENNDFVNVEPRSKHEKKDNFKADENNPMPEFYQKQQAAMQTEYNEKGIPF